MTDDRNDDKNGHGAADVTDAVDQCEAGSPGTGGE
jgi:hypothetical protein